MQVPFLSLKDVTNKYKDEIHEAVLRVVDSGWYLQGKENEQFEADYARYIGTKHCVEVASDIAVLQRVKVVFAFFFSCLHKKVGVG